MYTVRRAYSRTDVDTELLINRALLLQQSTGLKDAHTFLTRKRIKAATIKRVLACPGDRRGL
ncbi:hypothetical protein IP91_01426 [Pseudoduganella lurida]|uniref:Uncharacterized protein n=1 Tax=Pseudoduganella lurida TaxID=1036180 RepID=A0A562REG8_9BURK|nr:hypothetical protein [Pseudoduganella lurida]TWI67313.1 hypothetical protein IP91_01426 [Pseudoduganella lurida]